jgi:hypothetical protein
MIRGWGMMTDSGVRARVFLSSTTVGLRSVRDVARQAIEDAGCDPIVMEEFGAVPDYPDSVCQDRIDTSDVYVGLIGWRHGSRPAESDQSYTEREYRYARLRGLPCLIFLLSEDLCREELSAPAEPTKIRSRQEQFRVTVRQATTTKTVSDLAQLKTEVIRSLRDYLHSEPWGVPGIFGRRNFLRKIHHEIVDERLNLCLVGLGGIGKTTLVEGFRTWAQRQAAADGDELRVWFQALPEPAYRADAGMAGLALNDLADLARSALGHAARDVTSVAQLTDRLGGRLGHGVRTIVAFDNVWPTHVEPLRVLYQRLSSTNEVSFLLTSRSLDVPELLASGVPQRILPRPVPQLDDNAAVDLLTWEVARTIGAARESARPDLHRLTDVLRPLASFADGYPEVLRILAGLVVREGDSVEHLRSCAEDIEVELHEVRERLQKSSGAGEIIHANQKLDGTLEQLLKRWLAPEPDGLSGPARDLLAICAMLPPRPASYSRAMLQLHWQAALGTSMAKSAAGREEAPELYRQDGNGSRRRDRAFREQLGGLCHTQLLRAEDRPAGRESRCQSAEDRQPETHYAQHTIVARFFHDRLLKPGQRTELHEASEQALRGELEEGPLSNLSGMYAIEGTVWQEKMSLWLYHLAHLRSAIEARARMASLYLDAFWWWGYYQEFPFCDLLIQNWDRVVVSEEDVDDHVAFVHHLRALNEKYPRGWEKAGSDMQPVANALRGLADLISVAVDAPPTTYDDDEDRLHVQGLLLLLLAHCAFYRSPDRPIPAADFTAALTHYRAALASFAHRREHFGSYADEWNEAWTLYEMADLHACAGRADEAEELCDRAEALERDRIDRAQARARDDEEEEDFLLEETLGDIARVRADIAECRGDLAAEARQRTRAVFHAYAFQVRPPQATPCENDPDRFEGGPDAYTGAFYGEMIERAIRRVVELFDQGKKQEAQSMAGQLAASWQRQDRPEVVEVLDALGVSSATVPQPATLRRALFPPVFSAQADDLDEYVQRGLELAAIAERSAAW